MSGLVLHAAAIPLPGEAGAGLVLRLFGPMEVRLGSRLLPHLHSRKGLWLLALLALRGGRDVDRDWLAATIWPEDDTSRGRRNLRQSLYDLRLALGPEAHRLTAAGMRTLRLDSAGTFVDVLAFDAAVARGDPESLAGAVRLYRGPLLEDCAEEWCMQERRPREHAYMAALTTLAADASARCDYGAAAGYLQRAIDVDPYREDLQRALMQAQFEEGNPANALLVYRRFSDLLRREMASEPAAETTALFRQLRDETRAGAKPRPSTSESRHSQDTPDGGSGIDPSGQSAIRNPQSALGRSFPLPLTGLIGREEEVRDVVERLGHSRLVTLTGTGGIGKTRLALRVAMELADEFRDGVWFVELAALSDGALVAGAVAATLEISGPGDRPAAESLCEALRDRELLLALDNCEHLLRACAELAEGLLGRCAGVRILATSRQPLGLVGEVAWRVPSLEIPSSTLLPDGVKDAASYFLGYDAVRLFVARAQEADRRFRLAPRDAHTVAQLCRRLDGIPLAIELAAARVRAMPVQQLAKRLDESFRLLTGGSRTALPRQQTLRGAIDWSYDLLSEPERLLLLRLSVFAGGWTLEAAEAVVSGRMEEWKNGRTVESVPSSTLPLFHSSIQPTEVLDLLTALVDRSLVMYDEWGAEGRYRLLETVRQYSSERLEDVGERNLVRARHLEFFLALGEAAAPHLTGARQAEWLEQLETEHDNLRTALDHSIADCGMRIGGPSPDNPQSAIRNPQSAIGLRLAAALWRFWLVRGHLTEGRERLRQALARATGSTEARARALYAAGSLAYRQADYQAARSLSEESLSICRELGDRSGIADALNSLGTISNAQSDYPAARSWYQQSLAIRRELGDRSSVAASLNNLGVVAFGQGDYEEARSLYEESMAVYRELEDSSSIAISLNNLGMVARSQEDLRAARSLYEESLALRRQLGDRLGIAASLHLLGDIAMAEGDHSMARSLYVEGLAIRRELGERWGIAGLLEQLAKLACEVHGEPRQDDPCRAGSRSWGMETPRLPVSALRAVRLFGAVEALREAIGAPLTPDEREAHQAPLRRVRDLMGEEAFAAAWEEGRAMPMEQAIAAALEESGDA